MDLKVVQRVQVHLAVRRVSIGPVLMDRVWSNRRAAVSERQRRVLPLEQQVELPLMQLCDPCPDQVIDLDITNPVTEVNGTDRWTHRHRSVTSRWSNLCK